MRRIVYTVLSILAIYMVISCGNQQPRAAWLFISPETVSLEIGQTINLSIQASPEDACTAVRWSSSFPYGASISNDGTITGLMTGQAYITARSRRNRNAKDTISILVTHKTTSFAGSEWYILAVEEDRKKILSVDIIREMRYGAPLNNANTGAWAHSEVRRYLNGFYLNNFSRADRSRILQTNIVNEPNPRTRSPSGPNTNDYIFILSLPEARRYFTCDESRIALFNGTPQMWWLRTWGDNQHGNRTGATFININGVLGERGFRLITSGGWRTEMDTRNGGVRPAMWITIE
jgi:hypothetical protein